jgi:hypothetical protein
MQQRYRKNVVDRQSLFNIHLARFTDELNRTVEEAYRSLGEFIGPVTGGNKASNRPVLAIESESSEATEKGPQTPAD